MGNAAYEIDGTATWYNSAIADGPTAIADFDLDGQPEVVSVSNGVVSIVEGSTGTLLSTFNLVDYPSVHGGAPTIADYDGDGIPEIGIAGKSAYGTYEFDGTVVWQTTNSDASSNMTGSSVFDFDGDGTAEVVYADEEQLFILNGLTGVDRLASTGFGSDEHASATLQEYPSLADTDGDGSTEIILASADYWVEGDPDAWYGMRSIGSSTSAWMPSRPIWNQHSYSITNINDDGSVPPSPTSNWHTWNNYRTADLSEAPGDWLSNLYPADIEYCVDCEAGEITFYGTVANEGLSDSGPFDVVFLDDGVPIATDPVAGLASGDTIGFGPIVVSPVDWNGTLTIYVDQGLAEEECDELDNEYVVGESPC